MTHAHKHTSLAVPETITLNGRQIRFLHHTTDAVADQPPVVILGGVFQRLETFYPDAELIGSERPVYLVDLPGQGGNEQAAPDMDIAALADTLRDFMDALGIERIVPLVMSLSSGVGYLFALRHPERTEKLIMATSTADFRHATRQLLRTSLDLLAAGQMDEFATAVVTHLMNFPLREKIPGAERMAHGIHRNLSNLPENERTKYRHNVERLLAHHHLPDQGPECPVLIISGAWDSFTTPQEGFELSQRCRDSVFATIEAGDHLSPTLSKEVFIQACLDFLAGRALADGAGLSVHADQYARSQRLTGERIAVQKSARVAFPDGHDVQVLVHDVNEYGCRIETRENSAALIKATDGVIHIEGAPVAPRLIPIRTSSNQIGALFMSREVEEMARMQDYVRALG